MTIATEKNQKAEQTNKMSRIEYVKFATDETPHCLWDFDNSKRNLDFLNSIDAGYFQHIADIHSDYLEGDEKQYAAIALRVAYSHGLESLFALLCAVTQSHDCIVGWMIRYKNSELDRVVRKIQNSEPVKTKLNVKRVTWRILADLIFRDFKTGDEDMDIQTRESFGKLWRRFASNYLDDHHGIEYNNIKHGLRARLGGIKLAVSQAPHIQGEFLSAEKMITLSNSVFGSTFLIPEKLHDNRNFALRQQSVNWKPQKFIDSLELISMSIQNVVIALKAFYGADLADLKFSYCASREEYEKPWLKENRFKFAIHSDIRALHIKPFSKEEILSAYDISADDK